MNKGIWLTVLSGIMYGSIGYFGETLRKAGFSIDNMLFWRFLISTLMMLPFLFCIRKDKAPISIKPVLLACGLGSIFYSSSTAFYFIASAEIGTGLAMVIFYAYPAFVVLIMWLLYKGIISNITIISTILIIIGCAFITGGKDINFQPIGTLYAVLSAIMYAFYMVFSKNIVGNLPATLFTLLVCAGNTLAFFILSVVKNSFIIPHTPYTWMIIILFSAIGTVIPLILLIEGMKYISASKASILSVFEPVVTLIIGIIFLGEAVLSIQVIGIAIILASAIVIQLDKS
jgi:drug/metabolite transporter (DMT)-like permease